MAPRSPSKAAARSGGQGMVASGLASISGKLFPETRQLIDSADEGMEEFTLTNTTVASSLPLQMLLYFNIHYSIFWTFLTLAIMIYKDTYLGVNSAYRILSPLLLSVWCLVEPLRLYFGYVGNLQEKVPQLTGFWLFTLLPQIPIAFFFIISLPLRITGETTSGGEVIQGSIQLPFDRAGSIVLIVMLGIEAIVGYIALRVMVKSQVLKFHLQRTRDEGAVAVGKQANRV
uniref:Transmembrane protein 17 n=1 Tax=Hemiselmis andersenii TaxID=464988 RepID=A0A6T8KGF0_HEMAN|mmetsp:Transcript_28875/g.67543  ORF Transcript_28875/g.67543 Transcript_28875/m.67543 type:complete len:230 (-) Transcript_28875:49-738(-)